MKKSKVEKPELLPGIEEYFESLDNNLPISTVGLEQVVGAVMAKTNLNEFDSNEIVRLFFQEIRNSLLKKSIVDIRSLGRFYVSSPKTSGNTKKVFVKFKPKKSLIRKMNK